MTFCYWDLVEIVDAYANHALRFPGFFQGKPLGRVLEHRRETEGGYGQYLIQLNLSPNNIQHWVEATDLVLVERPVLSREPKPPRVRKYP